MATAGVYALLSFLVTQRTREIGVRLALGASPARTLRMIVGQSLGWASAGIVAGLAAALAAGRFIEPLLFRDVALRRVRPRGHGRGARAGGGSRQPGTRAARQPRRSQCHIEAD